MWRNPGWSGQNISQNECNPIYPVFLQSSMGTAVPKRIMRVSFKSSPDSRNHNSPSHVSQVLARLWCHVLRASSKTPPCFTSGSSKPTRPTCTTAASWFSITARSPPRPSSSPAKTMPCATKPPWKSVLTTGGRGAWLWRAGGGRSRYMRPTCDATRKTTAPRWRNFWTRCPFLSEKNTGNCRRSKLFTPAEFKRCFMMTKRHFEYYLRPISCRFVVQFK